jgi:hypothetical protein
MGGGSPGETALLGGVKSSVWNWIPATRSDYLCIICAERMLLYHLSDALTVGQ